MSEFDVLVLDVMLPGLDGVSIVRQLRQRRIATPILLATARDTPDDITTRLDAGADDYLTKPFSFKVLLARLPALARRRQVDPQTMLRVADLSLDPPPTKSGGVEQRSRCRGEFVMRELLMRNPGRVITRDRFIRAVWGHERDVQSNTLGVFIRQLRAKIEPPGSGAGSLGQFGPLSRIEPHRSAIERPVFLSEFAHLLFRLDAWI
jgi:DNA-binding response OmpR family regulator